MNHASVQYQGFHLIEYCFLRDHLMMQLHSLSMH
jgi:hypothetical protein